MSASTSSRARLFHIRDEIEGVAVTVRGLSFERYQLSYVHRRAALPRDLLGKYDEAPWASIIGIGNVLRHEYQRLDDRRIWELATVHLPALEPVIRRMIAELDD